MQTAQMGPRPGQTNHLGALENEHRKPEAGSR